MKESDFISKNKNYWISVEKLIKNPNRSAEEAEKAIKKIAHDSSVASTFFYNRSIRVYLNGLYSSLHDVVFLGKEKSKKSIITFWTDTVPYAVYSSRKELLVSLIIFGIAVLIGAVSTYMDPDFPRLILGDRYVDMTLENIAKGDPMSVYKDPEVGNMTLNITLNNILVSFFTYVLGVFYMIGSALIIFKNGVMLGAFQYFFVNEGLFRESFLTIWMHGTIEIASIVIAGGAGFVLGRGIAFPGTFSRTQSFVIAARESIIILASLIPLFMLAGTIEGTLTRWTELNDIIRGLFIFLCAAFIFFYYAWYPYQKFKNGFNLEEDNQKMVNQESPDIPFGQVLNLTGIFYYTIGAFNRYGRKLFLTTLIFSAGVVFYIHFFSFESMSDFILGVSFENDAWDERELVFYNNNAPYLHIVHILAFVLLNWMVLSVFKNKKQGIKGLFYRPQTTTELLNLLLSSIFISFLFLLPFLFHWTFLFLIPVFFMFLFGMIYDIRNKEKLFTLNFSLLGLQAGLNYFFWFLLILIFVLVQFFLNSQISEMIVGFIIGSFNLSVDLQDLIYYYYFFFTTSFSVYLIYIFYLVGLSHLYNSSYEISTADELLNEVNSMGKKKIIKGMERE